MDSPVGKGTAVPKSPGSAKKLRPTTPDVAPAQDQATKPAKQIRKKKPKVQELDDEPSKANSAQGSHSKLQEPPQQDNNQVLKTLDANQRSNQSAPDVKGQDKFKALNSQRRDSGKKVIKKKKMPSPPAQLDDKDEKPEQTQKPVGPGETKKLRLPAEQSSPDNLGQTDQLKKKVKKGTEKAKGSDSHTLNNEEPEKVEQLKEDIEKTSQKFKPSVSQIDDDPIIIKKKTKRPTPPPASESNSESEPEPEHEDEEETGSEHEGEETESEHGGEEEIESEHEAEEETESEHDNDMDGDEEYGSDDDNESEEEVEKAPEDDESEEEVEKAPEDDESEEEVEKAPEDGESEEEVEKASEDDESEEEVEKAPEDEASEENEEDDDDDEDEHKHGHEEEDREDDGHKTDVSGNENAEKKVHDTTGLDAVVAEPEKIFSNDAQDMGDVSGEADNASGQAQDKADDVATETKGALGKVQNAVGSLGKEGVHATEEAANKLSPDSVKGLIGKNVNDAGEVVDESGKKLGKATADHPPMAGNSNTDAGEITDAGEVVDRVSQAEELQGQAGIAIKGFKPGMEQSGSVNAHGIQIEVHSTKDGVSVTINIPGVFQQQE